MATPERRATVEDVLRYARGLRALAQECNAQSEAWSIIAQARKVNKQRGAWRRPALAGSVSRLEKALRREYARLERQVLAVLAGATLEEARAGEEPEFDETQPVDRRRLAAVLILLGLWRERQLRLLEAYAEEAFQIGREQVLKRAGYTEAPETPATAVLLPQLITRFEKDSQRFHNDLLDGSPRSRGAREIVEGGGSLGEVMNSLRSLFDSESFRLGMWSEALVFSGWMSGFRAGAVDSSAQLVADGLEPLRLIWAGPQDESACQPCLDRFGPPFEVRSLADAPDPTTICEFRLACRHYFKVV